ncbi:hypothetical protein [Vannielia litorea]|uniref:hypothetical protein n=1 Tax=Vannielia litorea TaxID=1217970 RepID=UPI001BCF1577|nr:hypothetical protein [Vannielia litorea]MBS8226753.1 hypothetical protein [Vannielia litorea]
MGYDIFCTGVIVEPGGGRHRYRNYQKYDRDWGDEWAIDSMIDTGLSFKGLSTGGSIPGAQTVALTAEAGSMLLRRQIAQALTFLTVHAEGEMSIFLEARPILGFNRGAWTEIKFRKNSWEVAYRKLLKFMDENDVNKMGPLMDLLACLNEWSLEAKRGYYYFIMTFKW